MSGCFNNSQRKREAAMFMKEFLYQHVLLLPGLLICYCQTKSLCKGKRKEANLIPAKVKNFVNTILQGIQFSASFIFVTWTYTTLPLPC